MIVEVFWVHIGCNLLQLLDVSALEALLKVLGQTFEDLDWVQAARALALLQGHLVHRLDQRDWLGIRWNLCLLCRLCFFLLLLDDGPLNELIFEMIHSFLKCCFGSVTFKPLEESRNQVARRTLHRLCELKDLRDNLALTAELLHPLPVSSHLLRQGSQHKIAVGILLHQDVPTRNQETSGLLPIRILELVQESLVLLLVHSVLINGERLLSFLQFVFSTTIARVDDGSLLCDVAQVLDVERSPLLHLLGLVHIALFSQFLLLFVDFLFFSVSGDSVDPDIQVLVEVGVKCVFVITQLDAVPLAVVKA
mmetsp:Transcript_6212/g.14420  ORF Transcript_6212/g.14420 Transcript_6212/m.14420 type:complete len:308 (+) Transcript_6212:103-1026(+)